MNLCKKLYILFLTNLWKIFQTKSLIILLAITFVVSCGRNPEPRTPILMPIEQVQNRVRELHSWTPVCAVYPQEGRPIPYPCKQEQDGDVVLWAGLLCLSGEQLGCDTVEASFEESGKPARSPYWAANPKPDNEFSRDMFVGYMAYLVATKDVLKALELQTYMEANDNRLCERATDNRCTLTVTTWGLMAHVWNFLDLPLSVNMKLNENLYQVALNAQAANNPPGYPQHLVAVQLLLAKRMGLSGINLDTALNFIVQSQPQNPFFVYLKEGASDKAIQLYLAQSSATRPGDNSQWSIERAYEEEAWKDSMAWEFVFLGNLLQGRGR